MICLTLLARSATRKGLVINDIPGGRCPFPMAAFSAKPVTNSTLRFGRVTRAASATCRPFIPPGRPTSVIGAGEKPQMGPFGKPIRITLGTQGGQNEMEITKDAAADLVPKLSRYLQSL